MQKLALDTKNIEILLPSTIFQNRKLSFLEAIVCYLVEIHKLSFAAIAQLTNRDQRNIWTLYNRAAKKLGDEDFEVKPDKSNIFIPLDVVRDRSLSILEVVVFYLRDQGLTNKEIAEALDRSQKTTSTAYTRARKKNE